MGSKLNWLWVGGAFFVLYWLRNLSGYRAVRYAPGSLGQISLFQQAATRVGLPTSWANSPGLIQILSHESNGWVGRPNYTYGERARNQALWPSVVNELRAGIVSASASASGLGQLLLTNVEKYYPSGRKGIGVPVEEAAGMLRYIKARYGDPDRAWAVRGGTDYHGY